MSKRLSHAEIHARTVEFANEWATETRERAEAQSFWVELLACYGVNRRRAGAMFEFPARRASTGNLGSIDLLWPGILLAEHKSAGRLRAPAGAGRSDAENQALDYIQGGTLTDTQMPRYVMTSDFASIQITDLEAPTDSVDRTLTFATIDLPDHYQKMLFLADGYTPEALGREAQGVEASQQAVALMGALYEAMMADAEVDIPLDMHDRADEDEASQHVSIMLTRLLFLLAGDDSGLWPHDLFTTFVRARTVEDGSDLGPQIAALFDVLNTNQRRRSKNLDPELAAFPFVNGGIFKDRLPVMFFNRAIRNALLACCDFNWTRISPAIFGSLFQAIKSKKARHGDGEHYTSETNILRTIEPLFLDQLRARLERTNSVQGLRALWDEIGNYRYFDPACGCGNFLVVAYREMRQIELDLIVKIQAVTSASGKTGRARTDQFTQEGLFGGGDLRVRLDQFYGIELNWWPAKIAETAMFLVDHQANRRMEATLGVPIDRLPIEMAATIHHGNALTTDWDDVCPAPPPGGKVLVFGNPPFLGKQQRQVSQTDEMRRAWGRAFSGDLDYVTAWHAKAITYMDNRVGEWAFVATNSIAQGVSVPLLFSATHNSGWRIKFAHRTFVWGSESRAKDTAAVHVVIVGFTRETGSARLFAYTRGKGDPVETVVSSLNGYLTPGDHVVVTARDRPLSPMLAAYPARGGSMPADGGHLILDAPAYAVFAADPDAAPYIRKYAQGKEFVHKIPRWCIWMPTPDPGAVSRSRLLRDRFNKVRDYRENRAKDAGVIADAAAPYRFHRNQQPSGPYVGIPKTVSENRPYWTCDRMSGDTIAGDMLFNTPDPDGFSFAILSSAMFITWQKTVGGRLKSDPRFASTLTWHTFPMPEVDAATRKALCDAGQAIIGARARHPERSLASHYDPLGMDPALLKAHHALDSVLDRAFGSPRRIKTDLERQRALFVEYQKQTAGLLDAPVKRTRARRAT